MPNKKGLWEALKRNQFNVPPLKDALCTKKWLLGVKNKVYWCLHASEAGPKKEVASVPSKKVLGEILVQVMRGLPSYGEPRDSGIRRTADHIEKKQGADVHWMILILSTISPEHFIFAKDYVKPLIDRGQEKFVFDCNVPNDDGFFTGLPVSTSKGRAANVMAFMDAEMKKQYKLAKMQWQMHKLQQRMNRLTMEEDDDNGNHN